MAHHDVGSSLANAQTTVLVTGGTGYLAGWTIIELLERGFTVRVTVRSMESERSLRTRLARYSGGLDRLSLYPADLLADTGWAEALRDVDYVLHLASPMSGADVIAAARQGTLRVIRASADAGVRRVVLTSSGLAASQPTPGSLLPGQPIDETHWTDLDQAGVGEYMRAKTLAEQDAWAFVRSPEVHLELVTILPGFIQGPALDGVFSDSVGLIASMLAGKMPALPNVGMGTVDSRDLADIHIRAMHSPDAAGQRFIASGDFLWFRDMATILKDNFGSQAQKVSLRRMPDWLFRFLGLFNAQIAVLVPGLGQVQILSAEKAHRLLGWSPRPAAESIIAAGESLITPTPFAASRPHLR